MLTLNTKIKNVETVYGELVLPYASREKSRQRAVLRSGEPVAVLTVRGTVLRHGDLLQGSESGDHAAPGTPGDQAGGACRIRVVRIIAADEETYRITCATAAALLRCAFHLGNRHTQVQVGAAFLRIGRDPVLKDMLTGLGAEVAEETAAFEPESGAYSGNGGLGGHHHEIGGVGKLLAPVPLRQKIHRPGDGIDDATPA